MVVICFSATALTGSEQERIGAESIPQDPEQHLKLAVQSSRRLVQKL